MVSLSLVQASNSRVASTIPARSVAVFVGATSGIGEFTLKHWAKSTLQPRVYLVGRSQQAADRITAECKALNPQGEFHFIRSDISLINNVDEVCRQIQSLESSINLLVLSQGSMLFEEKTSEGLLAAGSLVLHSRFRFIVNLLPQLRQATALRRVVSILCGTKEGAIDESDLTGAGMPFHKARGHGGSMHTLGLEHIAERAPEVSFIHDFPGPVKTNIARGTTGLLWSVIKVLSAVLGPFVYIGAEESGQRHLFVATSAKYPALVDASTAVPLDQGVEVARGTDSKLATGVYSIDQNGESADPKVEQLLAGFRQTGMRERVWEYIESDFKRITGTLTGTQK